MDYRSFKQTYNFLASFQKTDISENQRFSNYYFYGSRFASSQKTSISAKVMSINGFPNSPALLSRY